MSAPTFSFLNIAGILYLCTMFYLNHLLFGFAMAAVGVALPGMINMTSVSTSLKKGLRAGLQFSIGSSIAIFFQVLIAVFFAGFLGRNPEIFIYLKRAAIFIFLVLSIVFLYQALHPKEVSGSSRKGSAFLTGMVITNLNVLNIPYYFTFSTYLKANRFLSLQAPFYWFFILGSALGALSLLAAYAHFADYISKRAAYFTRNINYFLSGIFLMLAIIQVIQLISD